MYFRPQSPHPQASRVSYRCAVGLLLAFATAAFGQASQFALRFFGTGVGPPGQQDRVRIQIDDNAPGPDASAPCDIGATSFTIEFWLRGTLAANNSGNAGGDVETSDDAWIYGNVVVDRDIWGGGQPGERKWGISLAGGFVRFGTSAGEQAGDSKNTIEGSINVLDNQWHHVACVRDAVTGRKHIFVDGILDFSSSADVSNNDISYPNNGAPGQQTPWGPYIVLAAEKHDAGSSFPSFNGWMDEVRFWSTARTQRQIFDTFDRVILASSPGLVGYYRFEEGSGASVADSSAAGSPAGVLIAGVPGNGEWAARSANAANVAPVSNGILPAGFSLSTVLSGVLTEPTTIEFLPDGRLLIAERNGRIRIYQNGILVDPPAIELPANTLGGERGLVGLTRDPSFTTTNYLYCYWTTNEPRNRVSRFTLSGNTINPASELVLWENVNLAGEYHHGGALAFGPDGNLYIATGDQFNSGTAQPLSTEDGKVLRVQPNGTIPPDNPFVGTPGARPAIWLRGERNPFRIFWDLPASRLYIGNVGGNSSTSWEEINLGNAGANDGWPDQEGPNCFTGSCTGFTYPWYQYRHDDANYYFGTPQASITVGPVYRATSGAALFPPAYRANLYVGDYANRWIRRLVLDAAGNMIADPFFLRPPSANTIVDLEIAPDGSLYFVTFGLDNSGNPDPTGAGLFRIAYTGTANQAPIVVASANPTEGPDAPLPVQFSSVGTSDPDGGPQPLSYNWVFGDGNTSAQPNPLHTYTVRGQYVARLTASDGAAAVQSAPITITVGQRPDATMLTPPAGTTYRAGDTINFSGNATDPEDGTLPPAAFTWQVVLRHLDHTHPAYGPVSGITSGSFMIEDVGHPPENTNYEIQLTVRDSDNLTTRVTRTINPVICPLVFDTQPSGIPIFLDGEAINTPRSYASLENYRHQVEAQASFVLNGIPHQFACWSNGGPRMQSYTAPPGGGALTAYYTPAAGQSNLDVPVAANNRNADYNPAFGTNFGNGFDPNQLCVGLDGSGVYQSAAAFALNIPQGAQILSAALRLTASADNSGSPAVVIRGYDVGNVAPFVVGPTALTNHASLTGALVNWQPPVFIAGQTYDTPSLTSLVQQVVNRPDWQSGNYFGLVLDGGGSPLNTWRCYRNLQGGAAPRLLVTFSFALPPLAGDVDGDGDRDATDVTLFVDVLLRRDSANCLTRLRCDLNGDTRADGADAQPFVNALLGP